jgi:hypothetical protein
MVQTENKIFNRKKSKACYDKYNGRNKDRRSGSYMSTDIAMAKAYGQPYVSEYKAKRGKQCRSQLKIDHRVDLPQSPEY